MSDSEEDDKNAGGEGKIQRNLDSMLKQMEVTTEEKKYREENFDNADIMKDHLNYVVCTRCDSDFHKIIKKGGTVGVHPLLKVLMCDSCCDYFGDGNFSLDSEGEDKYCRWCGDGGTIFVCSRCSCGFCNVCIKKHFGENGLEEVETNDNWTCYFCNSKPLWYLRSICSLAEEAAKSKMEQLKKKKKKDRILKKKRRKTGSEESITCTGSNDDSSSNSCNSKQIRLKRSGRNVERVRRDDSSSSEDGKENHMSAKKRGTKINKQPTDNGTKDESSDSSARVPKKKMKTSGFESKKSLALEKLKSIWKLTESVMEAGLSSIREKVKILSRSEDFESMESLQKEHEDLKSCIKVLATSINSAWNSVNAIKDDLTFDPAKNETENIRSQEMKLKRLAETFQQQSNVQTFPDSDGNASQKELPENEKAGDEEEKDDVDEKEEKDEKEEREEKEEGQEKRRRGRRSRRYAGLEEEKEGKEEAQGNRRRGRKSKRDASSEREKEEKEEKEEEQENRRRGRKPKRDTSSEREKEEKEEKEEEQENRRRGRKPKRDTSSEGEKEEKEDKEENEEGPENRRRGKGPKRDTSSEGEKGRGKNASASGSENEKQDAGPDSGPAKPLLKVKSFARMLSDNVYDNNKQKSPVVIDLYEVDTDESESEKQKNECGTPTKTKTSKNCESKKSNKSESESEEEKKGQKDEKGREESDEESGKNAKASESKSEESKESDEEKQGEKTGTANEVATGDDGGVENVSSDDAEKKKKESQNSSNDESQKSVNERKTRRTRNSNKEKVELKASFEEFKRKRERFLRSAKETGNNKEEAEESRERVALETSESGSEVEKKENKRKNWRLKKKGLLASSDEENGKEKAEESKTSEEESEKENQNVKSDAEPSKASVLKSSSDEEEEEQQKETEKRKRIRKRMKESSDSGEDSKKRKKKRGSSSDSSGDEENKNNKKGRKNIKKILKKDSLQVETKEALKNEEERKKRLKEKQKLFEELFPQDEEGKTPRKLILDFDPETKEPLVTIHKKLGKKLKPHQISGVKFMWDNCFESVQKLEEESGSGCILAHCMGLGKTLQVVTLVHTVMTHDLGVNSVMIVCPLSTVANWIREFETWLENIHTEPIVLYDLVKYKKQEERRFHLKDWHTNGGVLVLSYDLFRNLTKSPTKKKERKSKSKIRTAFEKILLDPGPDLVVCDEGHLLKNEDTALSKCMSRLKTARRIVLTGTPLQNNLIEYHCMVQFVKPNILGTRKEFCNRFVNPINNGQFEDSTELDVKIMKRRSHVLHSMLEGCIQRFDYSVLTPFLPEKHEYVLLISLTDTQAKVYLHFIKNLSAKSSGSSRAASLFNDYHSLQRIWTHPRTLLMQKEREDQKESLASDSEGSLKDFVVSTDEETSEPGSDSSDEVKPIEPKKRILRSNANDPEVRKMIQEEEKQQSKLWWDEFYEETAYDDLRESNKLVLLFDLLKYCGEVKDKVLVFSQSLYSLDLIEYFLVKVDENAKKNEETLCGHQDSWVLGADYFRLDGSTSSETRSAWCNYFNKESNTRARLFLISTRAGGLGINLYGANRVVIFDASWNPSHDLQSIFRVYRFGQKKTCYIYRFLSEATMEEKIYERQVTKLSLAHRVVDEHQIERHYTMGNLQELYTFEPTPKEGRKVPNVPKDSVLAELFANHKDVIVGYHEHDSLLENKEEEELSEEERKAAWKEYEEEKVQKTYNADIAMQQHLLFLQQAQQQSLLGEGGVRFINPAHLSQMNANPIFLHSNIPIEVIQRGIQLGLTPFLREPLESFLKRIYSKEILMQAGAKQ